MPPDLQHLRQRAQSLHQQNLLVEAEALFKQVTAIAPNDAESLYGLGIIAYQTGRMQESVSLLGKAINLLPTEPNLWARRGLVLLKLQRYDQAIIHYDQALRLRPTHLESLQNRALALKKVGRIADAIASLELALALIRDPAARVDAEALLLHWKLHICQWDDFHASSQRILHAAETGYATFSPFVGQTLIDSPRALRLAAEYHARKIPKLGLPPFTPKPRKDPNARIRVGYFSADFFDHATMHLMAEVFEHHDRSRFEPIAFSFGPTHDDPWRTRAIRAFEAFHKVGPLTDREAALFARDQHLDIAVDLKGYTRDSRPGIFSERIAPVQINYLGYAGTMGVDFMDDIIADRILIPPSHTAHFSEKVRHLPNSYQPNCRHREVAPSPHSRAEVGLPDEAFVFCSFNAIHKLTPQIFSLWLEILSATPNSVLWVLAKDPAVRVNLRAHAQRGGLDPDRLHFAPTLPVSAHLARLKLADLMLDSFPCNAHTTASDALRMGLPIVTLQGEAFQSRVCASLLHAVGLPELVTTSPAAYKALAIELASEPERLLEVKTRLVRNLPTAPLFDSEKTTRELESIYREVFARSSTPDLGRDV